VLCNYFLQLWKIPVPKQALISIDNQLVEQYLKEGKCIDERYVKYDSSTLYFYGVEYISSATELDVFNLNLKNKYDYNKYTNPLDFIRIAVFDKWIGNMDRRKGNPNLLLNINNKGFTFIPIDHTQAFAYQENYSNLRLALMDRADNNSIMLTPMFKSICNFVNDSELKKLSQVILSDINNTLEGLDDVYDHIPSHFGLSKKGKQKILEVLSNKERNDSISKIYLSYCK
jgi:ATP-dependent Lon protease